MTIGSSFLKRLNEKYDAGTESAKRQLRDVGGENDFADKIAEVMNLCGVPGLYMNNKDTRASIVAAAQELRKKSSRATAFLNLHSVLQTFGGETPMAEAKNEDLVGNSFQQLVEETLVSLGAPTNLVGAEGKGVVKTAIRRAVNQFVKDPKVVGAFKRLARLSGVKVGDDVTGDSKAKKPTEVTEATTTGTTPTQGTTSTSDQDTTPLATYTTGVNALLKALGVPDRTAQMPQVKMAIRRLAQHDASDAKARGLMDKLTNELNKKNRTQAQ